MMNEADALDMMRAAAWTIIVVSAPGILAAMIVGLAVAVLQALTQIQEMTLTFVPKMIAIFAAVTLGAPLMTGQLGNLAVLVFSRIETGF
jgi:flagellar biosynthesis protein FliQ